MLEEILSFSRLADKFIAPKSKNVLSQFHGALQSYQNSGGNSNFSWEIAKSNPLATIGTKGYERGGGGGMMLAGEITSKWQIKREPPRKRSMPAAYFRVVGIASTKVRLRCLQADGALGDEIAMWRMELGDNEAPGCFFHSQILGESEAYPFPKTVSIPRLPIIAMTPLAVAEFVMSELFQDRWQPDTALVVPHINDWVRIQRDRFDRLLNWKLQLIRKSSGSPWPTLKAALPEDDLFV
jgi:hypothetical protein